jgi:RNA polymerase sigma-70 factor (ECF subfamily)
VLLERYVRAWEGTDLDGLVALLKEDAVLNMPPWRQWYLGREAIRAFLGWAWTKGRQGDTRLVPTLANRQPAFAQYDYDPKGPEWHAHAVHLLTSQDDSVAALTLFRDPQVLVAFGLPPVTPSHGGAGL